MSNSWILILAIAARPAMAAEVDPLRIASVRAEKIGSEGCDARCRYTLKVLEVIGGRVEASTISVSVSSGVAVPSGQFLVALVNSHESAWRVNEDHGKPVFQSVSSLGGLTSGQCQERNGKVADYDEGCSDTEVFAGRVLFMMCPCWCCVRAPDEKRLSSLDEIPEPNNAQYVAVRAATEWRNPFLSVESKGVRVLYRSLVSPENLVQKLANLPRSAWPYGRVVAVQDRLPQGALRRHEKVIVEVDDVVRRLEQSGIKVLKWQRE